MGVTKVKVEREEEKKVEKPKRVEVKPKAEIKAVVRVAGTDLDGERPLKKALLKIKGISHSMSKAVCEAGGFDPGAKLGSLSEDDIKRLEAIIKEPEKFGIPAYLLNRRKEPETGLDVHLTGADIDIARKFDIQREINLKTYRGWRHMLGQPVRGQRTRSSFRSGRVVGVVRKAVRIASEKSKEKK